MDKIFEEWCKKNVSENLSDYVSTEQIESIAWKAYILGKESKRKPKNDPHPSYSFCVEFWLTKFHPNWRFNGSEGKALNELIAQMDKYFIKGHDRSPTAQETFNFFEHFCLKLPNFYKTKNLKILNQNFDGIIAEIRAGRKDGSQSPKESTQQRFSKFANPR